MPPPRLKLYVIVRYKNNLTAKWRQISREIDVNNNLETEWPPRCISRVIYHDKTIIRLEAKAFIRILFIVFRSEKVQNFR